MSLTLTLSSRCVYQVDSCLDLLRTNEKNEMTTKIMTYLNMFLFMGTCIQPSLRMVELSSMMDSPFNHSTLVKTYST